MQIESRTGCGFRSSLSDDWYSLSLSLSLNRKMRSMLDVQTIRKLLLLIEELLLRMSKELS